MRSSHDGVSDALRVALSVALSVALRLTLTVFALAGCTVTQDEEVAVGQQDAEQVNAQLPIVHDSAVDRYVNALGTAIASHTSRPDLPWHFSVVNSPEVNAFALPGGFIYVDRGLIERADKLDQLAGVLGHEIGHVVRRHAVRQMQQMEKAQVGVALLCTLTRVCQHASGQVAINIGGSAIMARHSRQDETEADEEGVRNAVSAGLDPTGLPDFFQKLLAERQRQPTLVDAWFATHPLEETRIADTRRLIAQIDPATLHNLKQDAPDYHAFQDRVRALPAPARLPVPAPQQIPAGPSRQDAPVP